MTETHELAQALVAGFAEKGWMIATAESCTGGMIAAAITDIPGSSAVLDRGYVTYSNAAKQEMIGVSTETLASSGAVSKQTALEMAKGALSRSDADFAVSVTGIAGPDGGSPEKPVGLVHMAIAKADGTSLHHELRLGNPGRDVVRHETVRKALEMLLSQLKN